MMYRFLLFSLLGGGVLVSCQSGRTGEATEHLADNAGYSDGGFYGDTSAPAPTGYPRDGETLATTGGVPFGHNDPVHLDESVEEPAAIAPVSAARPVVATAPPSMTTPMPHPVVAQAVAAPSGDRGDLSAEAYPTGSSYRGDHGAEVAVVTPYVERKPEPTPTAAAPRASTKKPAGTVASSKAGGGTTKKPTTTRATAGKPASASKTVKTVYAAPGKKGASAKTRTKVVRVHDIKRGDTLSKLANRYGVSVAHLKKRNNLTGDTIVVGKRLTID
ncbi:MAG: LysM peptidoglycan-binding domain-containing protein [Verrucomicrobiales bacterium]